MQRLRYSLVVSLACGAIAGCHDSSPESLGVPKSLADAQDVAVRTDGDNLSSRPLRAERTDSRPHLFSRLPAEETGVAFANPIDLSHPMRRLYHSGFACGGVAIGDVDDDGWPDLYFVSGPQSNKLYRQVGHFRFKDITAIAKVDGGKAWGAGATMVDIDNDGDLDIFVCNYDTPCALYLNEGAGRFVEAAKRFGLDVVDASLLPAFCDYDCDGDLDLYLLTNRYYRAGGRPSKPPYKMQDGVPTILPEFAKYYSMSRTGGKSYQVNNTGRSDLLFRNDGSQGFRNVTGEAGIAGVGHGLSATWWDYNQDGFPDLYVANDFDDPDRLYQNNGDGTFTDVLAGALPHTSWFSMGADFADLNGDGLFDFLVGDMSPTNHFGQKTTMGSMSAAKLAKVSGPPPQIMRNALYLNTGTGRFLEGAKLAGLADSDWTWSIKLADLDNDGRTDVFITNGISRSFNNSDLPTTMSMLIGKTQWDIFENTPPRPEQNLVYRNLGDLQFEDVSRAWGLDHVGMSYVAAHADLDRDGDLDMVVANLDETVSVYRNESTAGHRLLIRLIGKSSNRFGIGATVRINTASGAQVRQLTPTRGFLSSNEPLVHFGLGHDQVVRSLVIQWPSGRQQMFENLDADRFYTVTEPDDDSLPQQVLAPAPKWYRASEALVEPVRHFEFPYNDFDRQPLLPNKMSQLGPGIAVADVNGDQRDDLYIGGAALQAGTLCVAQSDGRFTRINQEAFSRDDGFEDMASLFFDVDSDGDDDLYVVSGSVECEPGDEMLRDRLYLNDGSGHFTRSPVDALPDMRTSGSVVVACDFDRDGDLDLFVGGRVIAGQYPIAPLSYLLENRGGKFTDVTERLAPELRRTGLVTGAVWSDADGDGWIDLLVTHEWGPIKLFGNERGTLLERTEAAGLADHLGWWNGIAAGDFDGDQDIDYVVTNFGLNTKYHASASKPALLYYGDFDGNGEMRLVEAEFEDDKLFPIRGKSCSTRAMPFLADKYTTYKNFASATLQDIYTPKCLGESHLFKATTLESCVLINDGQGRFEIRPLPRLAQISPAFGVVVTEINGDGHPDLYLVQNFFTPQAETGRMDGGLSLMLLGNGDGTFREVWPAESGLIVPGDAKSLATCDLNGDGWPDMVVGVNNDQVQVFEHRGAGDGRVLKVRLRGRSGNLSCVGARVTLWLSDGITQTAEVCAGSGYLSQSAASLTFGLGQSRTVERIKIVWPNGKMTETRGSMIKLPVTVFTQP